MFGSDAGECRQGSVSFTAERKAALEGLKAAWDRLRKLPHGPERIEARWDVFDALDVYDRICEAEREGVPGA